MLASNPVLCEWHPSYIFLLKQNRVDKNGKDLRDYYTQYGSCLYLIYNLTMNYFQASPEHPYHLSVGAIPLQAKNYVYCLYWKEKHSVKNVYSLMTETVNPNETIETGLRRGLFEEMGISGRIKCFVGSVVAKGEWFGKTDQTFLVEKTTLYFMVDVESFNLSKRSPADAKNGSEVIQIPLDDLLTVIQYSGEQKILRAALDFIS